MDEKLINEYDWGKLGSSITSLLNLYTSSINQTGIENKIFIKKFLII